MPPPGNQCAAARKDLRVLLPFTCDSLRIPDELAAELGAGAGEALVLGPSGGEIKVSHVEVGRDGDGAFLGRGWPEFAAARGVGAGWLLVLRHRGRGVLSVKAFDSSCCLCELGPPAIPAVEATKGSNEAPRKPQFISILQQDFMEKMLIPAKFVQLYIPKEHLNSMAVISGPLAKNCPIELDMSQSEVFFAGGWSEFLSFHSITGANALLVRYEGDMVFTVKVFEPNGYLRGHAHKGIRVHQISTLSDSEKLQKTPSLYDTKDKSKNNLPSNEGHNKELKSSMNFQKEKSKVYCVYDIGPPTWLKKKVDTRAIKKHHLSLPRPFCDAIGFREPCMIMLQASTDSTRLWKVRGLTHKTGGCQLGSGWMNFCRDVRLREGDVLTINVIQTTLWHVGITRSTENINQVYHETPESGQGIKSSDGSLTCLSRARTPCVFEIGPPAWIKKEINARAIEDTLYLPEAFCKAIGLQKTCLITLKSSLCSARSWQVCFGARKNNSQRLRSGWKRFYQENELKVGDVCTFNIVESRLWHVLVERC